MIDLPPGDLWVFGYGSLMWRPDIPHIDSAHALVHGYHRALCVYSVAYRGTEAKPGLVFGLDRGGACHGMALRVARAEAEAALRTLWAREMFNDVYRPVWLRARLIDGRRVQALAFVAATDNRQYAGRLDDAATVALVLQGRGERGPCLEYLRNTLDHLDAMGIRDRTLRRIVAKAERARQQQGTSP